MPSYVGGRKARSLTDAEIVEQYVSGQDSESIAFRAQCSSSTVLAIVRANGGAIRLPGGTRRNHALKIPVDEIVRRYREGQSGPMIANVAGCTASTLYRLLRSHGVEIRPSCFKRSLADGKLRSGR